MDSSETICFCMNVTVQDVQDAIANGAKTLEEVVEATGASTGCGGCHDHLEEVVKALLGQTSAV